MNWKEVRAGNLKDILDTLEETFNTLGIDFYLIGAVAKEYWYSKRGVRARQTKDVDFAVLVSSVEVYNNVKEYLKNKKFVDTRQNAFVMISPEGIKWIYFHSVI